MPISITSLNNQRIRDVLKLNRPAERARRRATVVEGVRESLRALARGIIPISAFICSDLLTPEAYPARARLEELDRARLTWLAEVTPQIFAKLALRGDSGGLLLEIPYQDHRMDRLRPPHPAFLAVVEGVEKPGNLGAILRTADAAGLHGVIVASGATDLHNPNVVRASLGTLFTVPVAEASSAETVAWLRAQEISIVAATPDADRLYTDTDFTRPVAIILGSEAEGLSNTWRAESDLQIAIPLFGQADSLNLAASTAILLYEVVRQRIAVAAHP